MDNEAKLIYSDLNPHTKAELEAVDNYRNEVADSENDSNPTNFDDKGGWITLTKSGAYYGNLHYGTDQNTSVNNNDQLTPDVKMMINWRLTTRT